MVNEIRGQCYCGKIKYSAKTNPTSFQHCHCRQCQRLHGASFVSWVGFRSADCSIEDPKRAARIFNTGKADRTFCSNCGTHFAFRYRAAPDANEHTYTYFAAATITYSTTQLSNELNPIERRDGFHIGAENQPEWTKDFVQVDSANDS
jgi:hypothetical protein